jgi:multidrug efflux pump subunit AcrA (membrane-fusion protein)
MRKVWIGIAAAVLALIVFESLNHHPSPGPDDSAPLPLAYVAAEGKVEAMPGYDVDVGTGELNGRIARIFVKERDPVRKGQIVASLANEDLQALVTQAEHELTVARARLTEVESGARKEEILEARAHLQGATARMEEARDELRRSRELHQRRMVSQATLDSAEAAFKAAQAAVDEAAQRKKLLEEGPKPETVRLYRDQVQLAAATLDYARARLEKTLIRSPIDGTVIERYLDEGEGVDAGNPHPGDRRPQQALGRRRGRRDRHRKGSRGPDRPDHVQCLPRTDFPGDRPRNRQLCWGAQSPPEKSRSQPRLEGRSGEDRIRGKDTAAPRDDGRREDHAGRLQTTEGLKQCDFRSPGCAFTSSSNPCAKPRLQEFRPSKGLTAVQKSIKTGPHSALARAIPVSHRTGRQFGRTRTLPGFSYSRVVLEYHLLADRQQQ